MVRKRLCRGLKGNDQKQNQFKVTVRSRQFVGTVVVPALSLLERDGRNPSHPSTSPCPTPTGSGDVVMVLVRQVNYLRKGPFQVSVEEKRGPLSPRWSFMNLSNPVFYLPRDPCNTETRVRKVRGPFLFSGYAFGEDPEGLVNLWSLSLFSLFFKIYFRFRNFLKFLWKEDKSSVLVQTDRHFSLHHSRLVFTREVHTGNSFRSLLSRSRPLLSLLRSSLSFSFPFSSFLFVREDLEHYKILPNNLAFNSQYVSRRGHNYRK